MQYGDIITLGRHRLMCGDATKPEDVHALVGDSRVDLVLTDPPWGMKCQHTDGRVGNSRQHEIVDPKRNPFHKTFSARVHPQMIGDDSSDTARKHYTIARALTDKLIIWGGQYFADFLPISGAWLFWDKRTGSNDFSDGELAWCSWGKRVRKYTQLWNGMCMAGSYKLNARTKRARIHPTQKPVELHVKILEDFTRTDDVILDCFGGSGTTLIAAEVSGRTCLMMELSPEYCEIIKNRYYTLTEGSLNFV